MVNRSNYYLAREFLTYLRVIMRTKTVSVDRYWFQLRHVLIWLDEIELSEAHRRMPTFFDYMHTVQATRSLAPASVGKIAQIARRFFTWCKARHPAAFKRLSRDWINSIRLERGAEKPKPRRYFTLDEMRQIAALNVPESDLALQRDQAAACLLFLSGMRVGALVSLPISCVKLDERTICQFPSEGVHTKNGKHATTYLLNLPDLLAVVACWHDYVRAQLPPTAMWYAHISGGWDGAALQDLAPAHSRSGNFNKRLRQLLLKAGVEPRSAHKFRHGHAVYGLQHAKSLADYKAVSQNLMHENIQVTDGIYADLVGNEVKQRVTGLGTQVAVALPSFMTGTRESSALLGANTVPDLELMHALTVLAQRLAR